LTSQANHAPVDILSNTRPASLSIYDIVSIIGVESSELGGFVAPRTPSDGSLSPMRCGDSPLGERAADEFATGELLTHYSEVVRELGGNPDSLLLEAGIQPGTLSQCRKVPLPALGQLLEDTAARLRCPDLGLRLAERHQGLAIMQPLERLLPNAPTFGHVLQCCIEHIGAFNPGVAARLQRDAQRSLYFYNLEFLDGLAYFPQLTEQLLLLTHRYSVALCPGARSRIVWFSHLNIGDPAAYTRRFGSIVRFGQKSDGLFFNDSDIKARVVNSDAGVFASECREMTVRFPARPVTVARRVREMICRTLAESDCTRERVAALLEVTERTLNRRLSKLGTTFEAIRDDVRRDLAFRYLVRGDLDLTEICTRLNYSELAVLSRSCRRWFGAPPKQLQRALSRRANPFAAVPGRPHPIVRVPSQSLGSRL
jgi:AraC-like DNA-binding protein